MEGDDSVSRDARRLGLAAAAFLLTAAVSLWPVAHETEEHLAPPMPVPVPVPVPEPTPPAPPRVAHAQPSAAPAPQKVESEDVHPHPFTPEREALQQELRLVGALQDALDLQDVPALRSLVERYRAHVPGDENKLAEGYARLADCLDSEVQDPGAARDAAATYYENERASTLRRYIRRYCLER